MISTPATDKDNPPSWQYVPLADYHLPMAPVTHSARERFASFRRLFQPNSTQEDLPLRTQDKLLALPSCHLDAIAPTPDWRYSAKALHTALSNWLDANDQHIPVVVIIGAPHSGNQETLKTWAKMQGWRTLKSPVPEQILEGGETWLSEQINDGSPWAFPNLEKIYLRHVEGLQLIRQFIDLACSGKMGQGVICCDSWAWAFIQYLWRGRTPTTLTLQSLDESGLINHFQDVVNASGATQLLFRQSDNGHYVLPPPDKKGLPWGESRFFQIVAAHGRGNFGVAQAVWRASMQSEPDENLTEHEEKEQSTLPQHTVWIIPWNQIKLPSLPSGAVRDEAFILHALLLHNGLSQELLQLLVPLSRSTVMATLYRLEEHGLLVFNHTEWQVTPMGYPAARQFLQHRSYLVDYF